MIQALVVATALGATVDVTRLVLFGIGALFVVIGNYLPKVRPELPGRASGRRGR